MLQRKPFLCGNLNPNCHGYPLPQYLLGLQNVPKKCLWFSGQKATAKYGTPMDINCQRGQAHNGRTDHIQKHSIQSLSEETAATLGMKTKRMLLQGEGKLKQVNRPKVMQKVSAFGPAHAEYARKLFDSKDTQCSNGYGDCLVPPFTTSVQYDRDTVMSIHEQALIGTTKSHLPPRPTRHVYGPQYMQPTLRIAMITPRSNGKTVNKPRNSASADNTGYSKEGLREKNPFHSTEKESVNGSCPTILQLLCEISSEPI